MIFEHIENIPRGIVRTFFYPDVSEILSAIESQQKKLDSKFRIVAYTWKDLPDLNKMLDDVLLALAQIALELWPAWYLSEFEKMSNTEIFGESIKYEQLTANPAKEQKVSNRWIKEAIALCNNNKNPLPPGFSRSIQALELSRALDVSRLIIVLGVEKVSQAEKKWFSFARASEWIAKETDARVAAILHPEIEKLPELDSILYGAVTIEDNYLQVYDQKEARTKTKSIYLDDRIYDRKLKKRAIKQDETKLVLVWPIKGRPHPFSKGEQLLAKKLASDPQLFDLFEFNQSIKTVRDNRYLVDLLWRDGKVVVEIDGFKYHGTHYAFNNDRNRDYDLLISGYLVLRLPHDEVINDPAMAIEKLRDVVEFRKKKGGVYGF